MALRGMLFAECDVCQRRSDGFDAALYSRVDVWQTLKPAGWTRAEDGPGLAYRCPECAWKGSL